jgi:prevent-host-death family protein
MSSLPQKPGHRHDSELTKVTPDSSRRRLLSDLQPGGRAPVKTVTIREAKAQLSRLLDLVTQGESFLIAKGGKPIAKVIPVDAPTGQAIKRFDFLAGEIEVPADFDRMGQAEIEAMFEGDDDGQQVSSGNAT